LRFVVEERRLAGLAYLDAVTELLQSIRARDSVGGVWEAADLQWWWRRDQHPDPRAAVFWFDGSAPLAASVVTDWGGRFGCDVIASSEAPAVVTARAWSQLGEQLGSLGGAAVEMAVRDDDATVAAAARTVGFEATAEVGVSTWMMAGDRPPVAEIPIGFRIVGRDEVPDRPHHMARRNGAAVADRLAECSLYRLDLDLAVHSRTGDVVGYGLFWADPVTGVGLVEPMRTESAFQRLGLARCVLTEGLARLAAAGCRRMKVTYMEGNGAARRLYLGAGFAAGFASRTYRR
jgi:ribosomal protein S18 acetylase RimI-like enzyme